MRTTLIIDDGLMRQIKAMAARRGDKLSHMVDSLLRRGLQASKATAKELPTLPSFAGGRMLVDVADRGALLDAMDDPDLVRR